MRLFLTILFCVSILCAKSQPSPNQSRRLNIINYVGKYSAEGMTVQVVNDKDSLVLMVPGAPPQILTSIGNNKFRTSSFNDEDFVFGTRKGKIETLITKSPNQTFTFKKISAIPDDFNKIDSIFNNRKTSEHFSFLYSDLDSVSINNIVTTLENSYAKVLSDFKIKNIPVTTVRIYPDLTSFHKGINFPSAPDNIQASAFGKSDFRMVSPNSAGADSTMLINGVVHEFTHCVHLNIDFSPNNPKWLWEGVAMYEADWF